MNRNNLYIFNMFAIKSGLLYLMLLLTVSNSFAQRDTTKKQVVDITSSYKPVLRDVTKMSLSATQLPADTSKLKMVYTVPAQNLFYSYQPVSLRPLAYEQDSALQFGIRNYLKVGIGNYTTPYVSARLGFGDGKTNLVNVYADYISSKGKIKYQDYSKLNLKATGSYFVNNNEIYGSAGVSFDDYYLYGYDHDLYSYTKSDIHQRYQNVNFKIGARNTQANAVGVNYNPSIKLDMFNLKDKVVETSFSVDIPAEKKIDDQFLAKLALSADFTSYSTKGLIPDNFKVKNNLIQISPSFQYTHQLFTVNVGVIPVIDNKTVNLLPNIYGEAKIKDKVFLVQAGLVGRVIKNTFHSLTDINPYLQPMVAQNNTREVELYGGIKSTVGKHFNFSAKAGLVHYKNFQFYLNDTTSTVNSFIVSNEPDVTGLRIHGDISYVNQDKFSFTAGVTFNGYTDIKINKYAWGTVPAEINSSIRWKAFEKCMIKSDLYILGGGPYQLKANTVKNLKGGADLSLGAEYTVNKKISAWLDLNNIFNSKYERWHNYQVYGINILAGVKYNF